MKTALAILATGDYAVGAEVMFHTLRRYGNLPDSVDCYAVGMDTCTFAQAYPLSVDYSWVRVSETHFSEVAKKFQALTLGVDRLILMDADMLCVGDCSYLWSGSIGRLPFYACRDTASVVYYDKIIRTIGLDSSRLFNAGTMVFDFRHLPSTFHDDLLRDIADGVCLAYDGGDQGYLNHYFQLHRYETGVLPVEYNESYDVNMPGVPDHAKRVIHFTGGNANPWSPRLKANDPRWRWVTRWQEEYGRCKAQ